MELDYPALARHRLDGRPRRVGGTAQWQGSLASYLLQVAAAGRHPQLAAALAEAADTGGSDGTGGTGGTGGTADASAGGGSHGREQLFDRAMTRILTGLLPPWTDARRGARD
ncbi:MAG: hypothetical protein ABSA53_38355 [Streptosporangiaceae bacterium]